MIIREAHEKDLPAILDIHNEAVLKSTAIWSIAPVDLANRLSWLRDRQRSNYPVLVAIEEATVLGFASFGDWRAWDGYRHTVEHSVYVARSLHGAGTGESLMRELIRRARLRGKHVMVAGIEAGNVPSIRLHEKLGFQKVGHMREVGMKFGRWLDLVLMQLQLDDSLTPPTDPAAAPA